MGWALVGTFQRAPEYTLALSAGFLLLGPFLCLGLYHASRELEHGRRPGLLASLTAWRISSAQLAIFAAVLLVLEMLWGRAAMIVFAISFDGVPDFSGPLSSFLTEEFITFGVVYTVVGAIFAGLIFAISVVGMLPGFVGLLVVAPVLGHASWHAYRAALADGPQGSP